MSKRPTVPETPPPTEPPAPHRDAPFPMSIGVLKTDAPVFIGAPPTEEAIEAVARRMCDIRGINPDATEYGFADEFGPHEWHLFFIRGGYRRRGERVLEKNWKRFYYQAADALIAITFVKYG